MKPSLKERREAVPSVVRSENDQWHTTAALGVRSPSVETPGTIGHAAICLSLFFSARR
jgi:hypothetical protein